jgi:hypothetical protein
LLCFLVSCGQAGIFHRHDVVRMNKLVVNRALACRCTTHMGEVSPALKGFSDMTKLIPAVAAALLTTAIATPVFAQAAIQEPGAYSFYHPNADVLAGRSGYRPLDANAYYNEVTPQVRHRSVARRHHRAQ